MATGRTTAAVRRKLNPERACVRLASLVGDGTLRKAPDLWRRWNDGLAIGVHRMQLHILLRGLQMLKPGGRLVYSTCSMNPIEDEV